MREREVERYLVEQVRRQGGLCPKWVSPGSAGVPDRLVIMDGQVDFVELKRPGETPRPLQRAWHDKLRKQGCNVYVLDSIEAVNRYLGLGVDEDDRAAAGLICEED